MCVCVCVCLRVGVWVGGGGGDGTVFWGSSSCVWEEKVFIQHLVQGMMQMVTSLKFLGPRGPSTSSQTPAQKLYLLRRILP